MINSKSTARWHLVSLPPSLPQWEPGTLFHTVPIHAYICTGMNYVISNSGQSHRRSSLCHKTGTEMELLFRPENSKLKCVPS